jgi:hypothetical protein
MIKKASLIVVFAASIGIPAFAQFQPPPGAGSLSDFYSPLFLSGGAGSVSELSPVADVLNPAAS